MAESNIDIIERARVLRRIIESRSAAMEDAEALECVEFFPGWSGAAVSYTPGDRVRYGGKLYKVLQIHTSQPSWTPDVATALFAEVLVSPAEIPDWVQPNSTNAYCRGDRVRFDGAVYESLIDDNVWSPSGYPAGWQEVTE